MAILAKDRTDGEIVSLTTQIIPTTRVRITVAGNAGRTSATSKTTMALIGDNREFDGRYWEAKEKGEERWAPSQSSVTSYGESRSCRDNTAHSFLAASMTIAAKRTLIILTLAFAARHALKSWSAGELATCGMSESMSSRLTRGWLLGETRG